MRLQRQLQQLEQMNVTDEDAVDAWNWFVDNPSPNISLRTFWRKIYTISASQFPKIEKIKITKVRKKIKNCQPKCSRFQKKKKKNVQSTRKSSVKKIASKTRQHLAKRRRITEFLHFDDTIFANFALKFRTNFTNEDFW